MGASRPPSRKNPLFQLASSVVGIRERVAGIPVYTVANKKNELVLVAGEHEGEKKQLGLFFFTEKDAEALIEQIREQNPSLAKDSQVMTIGMSDVYDIADKGNQDLAFRFMPDAEQVKQAMQIIEEAGLEVNGFTGVPVFQATGLSVKTPQSRRTPLFFNKSDLDAAVGNAYSQKMTQREQVTQAKVERAQQDMADANRQLSEAKDEAARAKAQAEVEKAEERISKYSERLADVQQSCLPGIEVGSLEEVLSKMEKDKDGSWSDVMFVPPGAASMIQEPSAGKH